MSEERNNEEDDFQQDIHLSAAAIRVLDRLFDSAPPRELRENLLEIYHTYLIHASDTLPLDFEKLAMNMYHLIICLGILEKEKTS